MDIRASWRASIVLRSLASAALAIGLACAAADAACAETQLRVLLDRRDGTAAPFFAALSTGFFRQQALDVSSRLAGGSEDAIERLAKGEADLALADINAFIRFHDKSSGPRLKAVFVVFNRAPYALIARKSRGVAAIADMAGKTLGVAEGDLSIYFWPALARQNGVDLHKIKTEKIGSAVRGPMLSAGQIDATTGLSYGTALDLKDRGVPADDLMVFRFKDFGSDAYGQAVIADAGFADQHADAIAGFIRAMIAGIGFAAKQPAKAADLVAAQMDQPQRDLEYQRLRQVLRDNILTDEAARNGLGAMIQERFDRSMQQMATDYKLHKKPDMADIFDGSFLPPPDERKVDGRPTN